MKRPKIGWTTPRMEAVYSIMIDIDHEEHSNAIYCCRTLQQKHLGS